MSKTTRVCVIGCLGKTGQAVCRGLLGHRQYQLVAGVDLSQTGSDLGAALGAGHVGVPIVDNLPTLLAQTRIDAAIDFTNAEAASKNVALCLQSKVPVLVGTTGLAEEDLERLRHLAEHMQTPVLVVPNFALGAILMMEFAEKAIRYLRSAEIIELHHPQKRDRPSGTALRTRELLLAAAGDPEPTDGPDQRVPIHSVRLPGLVAHQEVIFGDLGQTLTIRHDSFGRESFVPGVLLGLERLRQTEGLQIGLQL